jgi:hypothetical protein
MSSFKQGEHIHSTVQGFFGIVSILVLGFIISIRGYKEKKDFYQVTGIITSITRSIPSYSNRHDGKIRYLQVKGHPKPFELFIGKDPGDFSPAFEQLDQLKAGDVITVYYDEDELTGSSIDDVNRLAQFIDKNQQPYFIRSDKDKYFGYFAIGMSACIGATLLLLDRKRRSRSPRALNSL